MSDKVVFPKPNPELQRLAPRCADLGKLLEKYPAVLVQWWDAAFDQDFRIRSDSDWEEGYKGGILDTVISFLVGIQNGCVVLGESVYERSDGTYSFRHIWDIPEMLVVRVAVLGMTAAAEGIAGVWIPEPVARSTQETNPEPLKAAVGKQPVAGLRGTADATIPSCPRCKSAVGVHADCSVLEESFTCLKCRIHFDRNGEKEPVSAASGLGLINQEPAEAIKTSWWVSPYFCPNCGSVLYAPPQGGDPILKCAACLGKFNREQLTPRREGLEKG